MKVRLQRLQGLLREQQVTTQESMVGCEVSVLFEKAGRETGQMIGKSEYLHAVFVEAPNDVIGQVRKVRITKSETNSLGGTMAEQS